MQNPPSNGEFSIHGQIRPTKTALAALPNEPGVYKMLDKSGDVLYVGKAKNLKKRVSSYFVATDKKDLKTQILVTLIHSIDILVTNSEEHALLLENRLIKTFQPRYNILLKDDKSYPYIKITNEPFPKVIITRQKRKDNAAYFGPYASLGSTKYMQRILGDLFPIRDCSQPISLTKKEPKCINLDIGKCIGPCIYKQCRPEYNQLISELKLLLKGKNKQLLRSLKQQMKGASDARDFERAAILRDRWQKVEQLIQHREVFLSDDANIHIWVAHSSEDMDYVLVQSIQKGALISQRGMLQNHSDGIPSHEFFKQCFLTFFDEQVEIPNEILADDIMLTHIEEIQNALEKPWAIPILTPRKGEKKERVELAQKNAKLAIARIKKDETAKKPLEDNILQNIQKTFKLKHIPFTIIGIDISHYYGSDIVASAVYFKNGKPSKADYRQFKVRSVREKSNDPASIYEVVRRRLELAQKDGEPLPNLLLIDGGRGQINYAKKALDSLGLSDEIDLLSLAKREEEIYSVDQENTIKLKRSDEQLKLFQRVRDESHRFALTLQRKQRKRQIQNSVLLQVEGLGPKRLNDIYKHYASLDKLVDVPVDELAKVGGMGKRIASDVLDLVRKALNE